MKKILILLILCLVTSIANAEPWVCFDPTTKRVTRMFIGDGLKLGISGQNNTGIIPTCILATDLEYKYATKPYMMVDKSIVTGSRVVSLTPVEIDAIILEMDNDDKSSQINAIKAFDITAKDGLNAFIKVYNSKVPSAYRITKKEIIDQIKSDLGL